jgi:hypothetical protein
MGTDLDTYGMERETRKIIKIDVLGFPAMKASTLNSLHIVQHEPHDTTYTNTT